MQVLYCTEYCTQVYNTHLQAHIYMASKFIISTILVLKSVEYRVVSNSFLPPAPFKMSDVVDTSTGGSLGQQNAVPKSSSFFLSFFLSFTIFWLLSAFSPILTCYVRPRLSLCMYCTYVPLLYIYTSIVCSLLLFYHTYYQVLYIPTRITLAPIYQYFYTASPLYRTEKDGFLPVRYLCMYSGGRQVDCSWVWAREQPPVTHYLHLSTYACIYVEYFMQSRQSTLFYILRTLSRQVLSSSPMVHPILSWGMVCLSKSLIGHVYRENSTQLYTCRSGCMSCDS